MSPPTGRAITAMAPPGSLVAEVQVRRGTLDLAAALVARPGVVTAVLGPNGAGKSTLLACVAGDVALDQGVVRLGDELWDLPPSVLVPPERRNLGIVHQGGLLFPHLTALGNVAFGPRARGVPRAEARRRAQRWLDRLGVGDLAGQRPGALSGGQAQRVALARALAPNPGALLLDEPLAALDAGVRTEVRGELRRHLAGVGAPTVLVTHDPVDVLTLAKEVVVLEHGQVTQTGLVTEVAARPRSAYVADLLGTNLLRGTADGDRVMSDGGLAVVVADHHHGPVAATISPAAVTLHAHRPEGSARNRWRATVADVELVGDRARVRLATPVGLRAELTPASVAELGLVAGSEVWASVKATEVTVYPD